MSRSYKHNPVCTDGSPKWTKISKRFANKKVRHTNFEDLPRKGRAYRKCFETYDIHDWKNRCPKEQWMHEYKNKDKNKWEKFFRRK